jgi:ascorbate PTS system EIIA or EIIAB component
MKKLAEMLTKDHVLLQTAANDWKEAVLIGAGILFKTGATDSQYGEAIIRFTEEMGPYYVIAPGLAMPHARPEDGVVETGFSLVTLRKPVVFGCGNDPVDILLTLSAKDNNSHIEALRQVALLFSQEGTFAKVRAATKYEHLAEMLK